jgi:NAD(P)-dependent dehydrogenase (short-subunit alcohol dehydrogenase family)
MESLDFSGKVVIITGGTKGIGRVLCERFLGLGAEVLTCGRNEPESLPQSNGRVAAFVACDIRDPEAVGALVDEAERRWGRLDVVINNAGGSPNADAATASPRFSESIIRLNLLAPLHLAQRANLTMQQQPEGGTIINIASVSGQRPSPGTAAYGAAKAGLLNLTQSLAVEWAPKVRVNAVTCGLIETEQAELHYGDAEGVAAVANTVPLGRMGTPRDIADACVFLASPYSSYMSGGSILLHGGGERPAFLEAANASHS